MNKLKNPIYTAIVLALVLMCTIHHNAEVYLRITHPDGVYSRITHAYAYVIVLAIDLAVMLFVIHARKLTAAVFAGCIFALNMVYYLPPNRVGEWSPEVIVMVVASVVFSAMYSFAVYQFSEIFVKDFQEVEKIKVKEAKRKEQKEPKTPANEKRKDDRAALRAQRSYRKKQLAKQGLSTEKIIEHKGALLEIESKLNGATT